MTSREVAVRDSQLKIVPPSPPLPCLSAETSETGFFVFCFPIALTAPGRRLHFCKGYQVRGAMGAELGPECM